MSYTSAAPMHNPPDTKVTVLISGTGSNLQALINASHNILPHLQIVRVISNKGGAFGLTRVDPSLRKVHNLVTGKYQPSKAAVAKNPALKQTPAEEQAARERYDADLAALVLKDEPDLVICAGWMHIVSPLFLDPLSAKNLPVINLHPALPGQYDGIHAIERAYNDFVNGKLQDDTTGIMIHYVISEVDRGEPIVVRKIQCRTGETLEELTERVHKEEHELIVEGTGIAIINLWEARNKINA